MSVGILLALLFAYASTPDMHTEQPRTALVFYAQPQVSDNLWPDLFQSLHADLAAGIGKSPTGLALDQDPAYFRANTGLAAGINFSTVIVVKLLGRCDVSPESALLSRNGPMGWVLEASGKIQPYIFVDCARIAQALRTRPAGLSNDERRREMAQAIAHVVIHEWIHIATQSPMHGAHGITKRFLSPEELIAEPGSKIAAIATN